MNCQIEPAVSAIGVKTVFGCVEGITNSGLPSTWEKERNARLARLLERYTDLAVHEDPILEGYHILHDRAGVKRRKNIPSSENLIKSLLKHRDMPFISLVVDIYNIISMDSKLCVAAHDQDKIEGNLTVRFSGGSETYVPIGQDHPVAMNPHEYCYCDDSNEVLCRLEIRQVNKTKISENVKNVLYIIEGNDATEDDYLKSVMEEIIKTTIQYCGGHGSLVTPCILPQSGKERGDF